MTVQNIYNKKRSESGNVAMRSFLLIVIISPLEGRPKSGL